MPYEKLKSNNYHNLGGINSKVSPYATGPEEFLQISNMDFQTPGSLNKRQGSTQFLTTGVSGRITGINEFEALNGSSYITFGANTRLYYVAASAATVIATGLQDNALLDFETFVDRLFFCNGNNFMKWKAGATSYLFSIAHPTMSFINTTNLGASNPYWANLTLSMSWGYVNNRGFHGQITAGASNASNVTTFKTTITGNLANGYQSIGFAYSGATFQPPIALDATYGLGFTTAWTLGSFGGVGSPPLPGSATGVTGLAGIAYYTDSGPGTQRFLRGYLGITLVSGVTAFSPADGSDFGNSNLFSIYSNDFSSNIPEPTYKWFTLMPRWLEIYNNQLFMAGFSNTPSVIWFSDIGEPEGVDPTFNFEVRTNDGDRISGLKSYLSQLFMFKEKSFHALSGDDPSNFSVRQISDQYGSLSGRAIIAYENELLFLDKKGVAKYNGANIEIISNKVEPVFKSMNIDAAKDNAVMIHNRLNNQIWLGIPTNGATLNNTTVVFDYLVNAWTVFEGFNPSSLAVAKGPFTQPTAFYGSYASGSIFNFGPSFFGDNGAGITCRFQTRFVQDLGESVEAQFRRLYLNFDVTGASTNVAVNFMQDYGSSFVYSTTMPLNAFQSRIDFGIPARALSFEMANFSAVDPVKLHGFVIAHRFQRSV